MGGGVGRDVAAELARHRRCPGPLTVIVVVAVPAREQVVDRNGAVRIHIPSDHT